MLISRRGITGICFVTKLVGVHGWAYKRDFSVVEMGSGRGLKFEIITFRVNSNIKIFQTGSLTH